MSSGRCETLKRALPMARVFSSAVISVQSSFDLADAGQRADPGADVALDLGPQRAAGGGEGDGDGDVAVVGDRGAAWTMPELDDVAAQLGVDHAAQHGDDVVGGRGAAGATRRILPAEPCKLMVDGSSPTGPAAPRSSCSRRWATTPATPSTSSWPARPAPGHGRDRRAPSTSTPTPCAPTSSACATSACSRSHERPAAAVGRPQHRYSLGRRRARPRARAAGVPGAGPDAAAPGRGAGVAGRRRRRRRPRAGRADGGARRRPLRAVRGALIAELDRPRVRPRAVAGRRRRHRSRFTHCPFRELAEANPELVCGLHRGLVEGFVDARAPPEATPEEIAAELAREAAEKIDDDRPAAAPAG